MRYFKYVISLLISLGCVLNGQLVWGQTTPQNYPNKTVKIIVPFAPGGPTDVQGRWAAEQLSQALGQAFIVENQGGAGGVPATDKAVKSVPDGYTLLAGNPGPLVVAPAIRGQMPYNTMTDLEPIMLIARSASCIAVHPSVPARNVKEFIAYAKANDGKLNYGSTGIGTSSHLSSFMLAKRAGFEATHVPYKGADALKDLLAGRIQFMFATIPSVMPQIQAGKLRSLAVSSLKRSRSMPEVPTVIETGLPNFEAGSWFGFFAPKGTPDVVITTVNKAVNEILSSPAIEQQMIVQGADPVGGTSVQFGQFVQRETDKWRAIVKESGAKAE